MSPASNILHWLVQHSEKCGVLVKQAEDEIAVVNLAIGAGYTGVRSMCATSGGGFALMSEAIGEAAMLEAPVVIVNVQRGGPSTGLPTKTEQGDLNQAVGASQGDFPRVIMAAKSSTDCFHIAGEALNIAEQFQLPVIILSDLLLGENYETIEPGSWSHDVEIKRGELIREVPDSMAKKDGFKRYLFTSSGVSPRPVIGSEGMVFVAATDDHDEDGVLISDVFTNTAIRRKINEKRIHKMDGVLKELEPPALDGPADAEVTLIGWGSTWGVIREAAEQLREEGFSANQLHFKYLLPFHTKEALEILNKCKTTIVVELNATGQFARHLRAETGFSCTDTILKYDGEPFEPRMITNRTKSILNQEPLDLSVTEKEAREIAYHYIRVHLKDKLRPTQIAQNSENGYGEPVWVLDLADRTDGNLKGQLTVGVETGSTHKWDEFN
jgi:2-oxoglutarate ferredoxin oxidoreductase subunit alpha